MFQLDLLRTSSGPPQDLLRTSSGPPQDLLSTDRRGWGGGGRRREEEEEEEEVWSENRPLLAVPMTTGTGPGLGLVEEIMETSVHDEMETEMELANYRDLDVLDVSSANHMQFAERLL
uniref:Uncharacterized protein n=1 Tax=Knipowitschia caucasica TaxID=637954 RepID=A0AAV2M2U9_KNICA